MNPMRNLPRNGLIDAHHHLWDLRENYHPWLTDRIRKRRFGDYSAIRTDYRVEDYRHDTAGLNIIGSVCMEASASGDPADEVHWLERETRRGNLASAVIGAAELGGTDPEAQLDRCRASPAFRGLRISAQWIGDERIDGAAAPHLLQSSAAVSVARALEKAGHVLDVSLFHSQVPELIDLARRCPDLRIVVNHCGMPLHLDALFGGSRQEEFDRWRDGMTRLSAVATISVKLSGLWMAGRRLSPDDIRPVLETCIEHFGVKRCMFASNFPVDRLWTSYADLIETYAAALDGASETEIDGLFRQTALQVYGLT